ncbi:ORF6N domain-containing protein [Parabacteroides sp. AF17-28]|nr:ORF6N domain-containing protein [Parabacteroides sp. AF17-28]RHR60756.1 ORF6N domain-containing protein [Parabacteroides sp. AF17-28]
MEPTLIESKIYEIRGQRVMLDKDLADLYAVETKNLNKAVKRNPDRFPPDFMFQLTEEEFNHLRFHFGTSSWGGSRYMPYAFTEQGVAMLSGILRSPIAVQVNINIMRAFVKVRQYAFSSPINQAELLQLKEQIKLILSRQSEMDDDIESLNKDQETNDQLFEEIIKSIADINLRLQLKTTKLDRIRVKGYLK